MDLNFDEIPSKIDIFAEDDTIHPNIVDELTSAQELLQKRTTACKAIKPLYGSLPRIRPNRYAYKFFCICPRYRRKYYCCKHVGNIIIDRDVLNSKEHICYLATPKSDLEDKRGTIQFYHKKTIISDCTARIARMAKPDARRVKDTLEEFQHVLSKRQFRALLKYLQPEPEVTSLNIPTAVRYMEEERRLQKVARRVDIRRCNNVKKKIIRKQRQQIKKIICVLFEEMKEFLLNDQFLIDEKSTLSAFILQRIREFTDKDFYTTSNVCEYQTILANNLTVWINKFISNLNIYIAQPQAKEEHTTEHDAFLPIDDYVSASESLADEGLSEFVGGAYEGYFEEGDEFNKFDDTATDDTVRERV